MERTGEKCPFQFSLFEIQDLSERVNGVEAIAFNSLYLRFGKRDYRKEAIH